MNADVIVIGAGLAGMMAAYAARAEGAEVLLIDKGSVGRGTNSAMANGVFAAPTTEYSLEAYVADTIEVGRRINDVDYVKRIAREAPGTMTTLKAMGLDLEERRGQFFVRTPNPDTIPGLVMVKTIAQKISGLEGATLLKNFYCTELLGEEKINGVKGFDEKGQEMVLTAPATILATGGAGGIYLRNDNQKSTMGQGYALAARAGLSLWDMEFVQFYPLVLNEPRLPSMLVYPPYPKELKLINASGEDLLKKWQVDNINTAAMTKRDAFSVLLYEEDQKGPVYLDGSAIPEEPWEDLRKSLFKKVRLDVQRRSIAVAPAVHFFMGGVRTDARGGTALPGLFACGEIVSGLHGANRRGGNALTECAVMGKIAGRSAALYARTNPLARTSVQKESMGWTPGEKPSLDRLRDLRQKMRAIAWNQAGILRTEAGMKHGLAEIEALRAQLQTLMSHTIEERRLKEDLLSGVLVTQAILNAGLARQESRGSFIRQDFLQEDDQNWQKNSCLIYDSAKASFSLSHEDARLVED
ncbi:MAG: FAD-binding protein [Deltaproteobacteria bacterium]|nr:FAD-binding protein [Deltaproteobacteria bacterium]